MDFDTLPLSALEDASDYILITEAELDGPDTPKIVFANRRFLEATGYSIDEVLGRSPKMLQGPETDRSGLERIRRDLSNGDRAREVILNFCKDGKPYWVDLSIHPLRDADGRITHFFSIQRDITAERERSEQAVLDELLVRAAERIGNTGHWAFDLERDRVVWSEGVYSILKWDKTGPPPDVAGCREIIDPAFRTLMDDAVEKCIKRQEPFQVEVVAHAYDGELLNLVFSMEAFTNKEGRTRAVIGALRDISQEKRIADELSSSIRQKDLLEKNFAAARKSAKIGVFDYKIDQDLQFWSDELFEMTGLDKDAFPAAAEEFVKRIDEADRPLFDRLFQRAIDHGEPYHLVVRFHKQDGNVMRMRIHADVIETDEGRHIVGISRDVTGEIEASELLMHQEERFRIITDVLSDVVWDYDFSKGEIWVTPDWVERLGITLGNQEFNPASWTDAIVAQDRDKVRRSYIKAIRSSADEWVCEYRVTTPQKTYKHLEAKARILRDENGRAQRLLGSLRDLTFEKEQEKHVARVRTLEAIGNLTGGFAHDFNNLLMIVHGNAELLQLSDLDEDDATSVKLIEKAARSGAELTKRLLSFSGQTNLQKVWVDLEQTIKDLAILLKSGLTQQVALTTEVDPDVTGLEVDSEALEQAIINLVINARDALPQGGAITINCKNKTVSSAAAEDPDGLGPGSYVCISVSDNGTGMSEDTISKAFDPFFTTKGAGRGTGLGLSSVYGFAKQSGGDVKIRSEFGGGTTIDLYLPASGENKPATGKPPTASKAHRMPESAARKRILVVEDQPEVRKHVEGLLRRAGHEIVSVSDAHAALEVLENDTAFDLLFTDVIMPGSLNGVQLSFEAAKLSPEMKVLFTSGFPAEAFDEIGIENRDDIRLLKKPYRASELLEAIADDT